MRIEQLLTDHCRRWLRDPAASLDAIRAVPIHGDRICVTIARPKGIRVELTSDERLLGIGRQ